MDTDLKKDTIEEGVVIKRPLKKYILISSISLIIFVSLLTIYLVIRERNTPPDIIDPGISAPSLDDSQLQNVDFLNICVINNEEIQALIDTFETYQIQKDALGVLSLFTTPQKSSDITDFNNLSGEDTDIGQPRLFNNVSFNYNTTSYERSENPTFHSTNTCELLVTEQRSYYGGPTNPTYLDPESMEFKLTVVKKDNEWKVDRYESTNTNIKESRYSGFLMEMEY